MRRVAGLTSGELEMLDDFELRQLRDFVRGKPSVVRASQDEDIDLGAPTAPALSAIAVDDEAVASAGLVPIGVSFFSAK